MPLTKSSMDTHCWAETISKPPSHSTSSSSLRPSECAKWKVILLCSQLETSLKLDIKELTCQEDKRPNRSCWSCLLLLWQRHLLDGRTNLCSWCFCQKAHQQQHAHEEAREDSQSPSDPCRRLHPSCLQKLCLSRLYSLDGTRGRFQEAAIPEWMFSLM